MMLLICMHHQFMRFLSNRCLPRHHYLDFFPVHHDYEPPLQTFYLPNRHLSLGEIDSQRQQ